MTAESVLDPVHSSKVSKVTRKKRLRPHQAESISCLALLPPQEQTGSQDSGVDVKALLSTLNSALRRSERISKFKGNTPPPDSASTFLRLTHSSKVSKAARKKASYPTQSSTKQHADDTNSLSPLTDVARSRYRQKRKLHALVSASFTGLERTSSADPTLRRSKRISEKFEQSYASRQIARGC